MGNFQGYLLLLQPVAHLKTQSQTHLEERRNSSATRAAFQSQTAAQGTGHFSKGWKLDCLLKEDGCSLWCYPLREALAVLPAHAELSETFKNPSGTNPCRCCGGEGAGSGGAADLGAVVEMGGERQLLTGGTLPSSWHLLIFLANQVSLALCCLTGWEASLVAGDLRDLLLSQGTSQGSQR